MILDKVDKISLLLQGFMIYDFMRLSNHFVFEFLRKYCTKQGIPIQIER